MKREIKFRAWDKVNKNIVPLWGISWKAWDRNIDGGGSINGILIERDGTEDRLENEIELMQFTGLKDKNGKEIYEGDIVEYKDSWSEREHLIKNRTKRQVVDFVDGVFYPVSKVGFDGEQEPSLDSDPFEVIGNIYENPELLK